MEPNPRFNEDLDTDKLSDQYQGDQGPEGEGLGQEALGQHGQGGYGQSGQQGLDPVSGGPSETGSNWLALEGVDPDDLGNGGNAIRPRLGMEDREDNGQRGPTQENGGLGLGDEEGLGRTGLSEAGDIGDQDRDPL